MLMVYTPRNSPLNALALEYFFQMSLNVYLIIFSFMQEHSYVALTADELELCIRAGVVSRVGIISRERHVSRLLLRHHVFKTLEGERDSPRFYSSTQVYFLFSSPHEIQTCNDHWDDIPSPDFPEEYSNLKMEPISATTFCADLTNLSKIQFPLITEMDTAFLFTHLLIKKDLDGNELQNFLMVWDTSLNDGESDEIQSIISSDNSPVYGRTEL